jgi:ElaB/YqjD/DUF883 family membrane-anchored ribosome-binding protein
VVVVAPEGAAGLGDFRKEADRLAQRGLCQFDYRFAVFQGDGAAQSLSAAITAAGQWALRVGANAIAILRGGGATADLHWLDDLAIAQAVCLAPVPVLTGIGHERDQTVLDEVARLAAGTPSKLIQYIESVMFGAAQQAQGDWDEILAEAASQLQRAQAALDQSRALMAETVRARCVLADQILGPLRREVLAGARHLLTIYMVNMGSYSAIYGAFATLPLLLLWIYIAWVIVLLGAVLVASLPGLIAGGDFTTATPGRNFELALAVIRHLRESRASPAHGADLPQLAKHFHADPRQLEGVMETLVGLDWVGTLEEQAPGRPPRHVLLADPATTPLAPLMQRYLLAESPATATLSRKWQDWSLDDAL